jgi:hypothetical protein
MCWTWADELCLIFREDREITVQEPRTVSEPFTLRIPKYTFANGVTVQGQPELMPKTSAPPTDPNLVFQQAPDDAISA